MLFTWFMLAGLIFLLAPANLTNKFQFAFAHVFRWPLSIGRGVSLSVHTQKPLTDVVSRKEYNKLQNYLVNVEAQLAQELRKYEELSGFCREHPLANARFAFAHITKASVDELIIDRGEKDNLAPEQFVLGNNSIIGTVSEVSPHMAKVNLVTSPTSRIAARIANQNAIIQGDGNNLAKIPLFPIKRGVKIKVGDKVLCRPRPGFLNFPVIIGRVAHCKVDDENPLLWDITVEPACNIEELRSVDVIIMNPQE